MNEIKGKQTERAAFRALKRQLGDAGLSVGPLDLHGRGSDFSVGGPAAHNRRARCLVQMKASAPASGRGVEFKGTKTFAVYRKLGVDVILLALKFFSSWEFYLFDVRGRTPAPLATAGSAIRTGVKRFRREHSGYLCDPATFFRGVLR